MKKKREVKEIGSVIQVKYCQRKLRQWTSWENECSIDFCFFFCVCSSKTKARGILILMCLLAVYCCHMCNSKMELSEFHKISFFFGVFFLTSLSLSSLFFVVPLDIFFYTPTHIHREKRDREKEWEREEEVGSGHSFIHFSCCVSLYLSIIIIALQERRREEKSFSIIIITLSFSILFYPYNRIDPFFSLFG